MSGLWWATPLVEGQGGQGNSQDRCPDRSQQACPDSSPQLAWTQSAHSLYYFDVESPRPSLTRGTLEDPRQPESPFYLGPSPRTGAEGLQEEGGDLGSCWPCLCYCVTTDGSVPPLFLSFHQMAPLSSLSCLDVKVR